MTNKKTKSTIPKEIFGRYSELIATNPKVELKGAAVPYTSLNGHMLSYLEKDGSLGLRLPEKEREEFLKKYKTTLFVSYGIVKKEFVLVPEKLFNNIKELKPWFDISYEFVKTLKPK